MGIRCLALLLFLSLFSIMANAQQKVDEDPCNGSSYYEIGVCIQKTYELADKELNMEYKMALERIREEDKWLKDSGQSAPYEKAFRESQRAWLKFRDAECEFYGISMVIGAWTGTHIMECKLNMTIKRTEYFKTVFYG